MKLTTLGYSLVGILAGSMLTLSLCLLALTQKFNHALQTLDNAYFEQVLPLRQIDANARELRYYMSAAVGENNGVARNTYAIVAAMRRNQQLWVQLESVPVMDLARLRSSYDIWLRTSVVPLLDGVKRGSTNEARDAGREYLTFERALHEQISTMRQRGQLRHQHLASWQRHMLYLTLSLSLLAISIGAWVAWRTITRHSELLKGVNRSLAQANQDLELRVEQRTAALEQTNRDMRLLLARLLATQEQLVQSEKLAALGFLVAGVAHELNTPLGNSLLAATTLSDMVRELQISMERPMQRAVFTEQVDMMTRCCHLLEQSLHKSSSLIARFKEVAIDQHGERREQFELAKLLDDVRIARSADLREAECAISVQLPRGLMLTSYPSSLARVLHDLIDNALLHAFDGRLGCRIDIVVRETERRSVYISFRDNGRGMSPPELQRVFDPFFTTKMGNGSGGLGMTIVYNTVTGILGGTISVGIGQPSGTRVDITLPRIATAAI